MTSPATTWWFPDNTVLCNFAAVHRLDLLEALLRGRGRWTEAVAAEAAASSRYLPTLADIATAGWLGEPIEIVEVGDVDRIRRNAFGGAAAQPRQHLGEAQTCWLLSTVEQWRGSWWISDDRDALDYARFRGIITKETVDLVAHLVADGDISSQGGFKLLQEMADADRSLRMPASVRELE